MEIYKNLDKHFIQYGKYKIPVIFDKYNKVWFNAKETALSLGYKRTEKAISELVPKKYKKQLKQINGGYKKGQPASLYLSESGLYTFMINSRMPSSKKFVEWIVEDILPSIRMYGEYKLKKKYETHFMKISRQITHLEKVEQQLKRDLKKEKFPKGGAFYVINYSTDNEEIYRIGITSDMNFRKKVHDTHSLHKREVVIFEKIKCHASLEICVRGVLNQYRYKNRKDFFECSFDKVKKAVNGCKKNISNICIQTGGSKSLRKNNISPLSTIIIKLKNNNNILQNKINRINKKL